MGVGAAIATVVAALVGAGTAVFSSAQQAKEAKKSRTAAERAAEQQRLGNLTDDEAASASKKAFRAGLIFTSPTGTQGVGSRGSSRLLGT